MSQQTLNSWTGNKIECPPLQGHEVLSLLLSAYFAIWLVTSFLFNRSNFYITLELMQLGQSVHTVTHHALASEGISSSSTRLMWHLSAFSVLFYFLAHYWMLLLLLINLQCACVFSASVQPSAIHVAPMLQSDACQKFSYAFPKRLRHFFLFSFSQLSHVFSLTPFKNLPPKQSSVQHSNNLWAVIPGAAMETEELLEKSFLAAHGSSPAAWGTPPEAAIIMPVSLGQKVNCNSLFLSTDHRSILNKFPFFF